MCNEAVGFRHETRAVVPTAKCVGRVAHIENSGANIFEILAYVYITLHC